MSETPTTAASPISVVVTENFRGGNETAAGLMRNRCAFTARDMGADWAESFTYAIVTGWDHEDDPDGDTMREQAQRWGWDDEVVSFLREAHQRFAALQDHRAPS